MEIIYSPVQLQKEREICVALGNFDGVHKGHLYLIGETIKKAKENGLVSAIYTFAAHPRIFLDKNSAFRCITAIEEKSAILSELGADLLYFEDFETVKDLSPGQFCAQILIDRLNVRIAYCGENYSFAKQGKGTAETLKQELGKSGRLAISVPPVLYGKSPISSTRIRDLIAAGRISQAAELLGRPFSICFPVVYGTQLGRRIGVPTINQNFPANKLIPQKGVYACITHVDGKKYASVSNVGTKPTVTANIVNPPMLCETHIIGYSGNLYGEKIKVDFYNKLRDEKKFASLEQLTAQVRQDINQTLCYLEKRL